MSTKTYTFHQSALSTYLTCPERYRQVHVTHEVDDPPTDSTAIGTALHAYAEGRLKGSSSVDAYHLAQAAWAAESAIPGFRMVKVKQEKTALNHIDTAITAWETLVWPQLGEPIYVEQSFDLHFFTMPVTPVEGDAFSYEVEVRLAGTIDFADERGLWDWKTTSDERRYASGFGGQGWEKRRWAIQPTVYCYAASRLGDLDNPGLFTYAAVTKTQPTLTLLEVERDERHYRWLAHLCRNLVTQLEAHSDAWPLNDAHALCSPDFCPVWDRCKGAAYAQLTPYVAT